MKVVNTIIILVSIISLNCETDIDTISQKTNILPDPTEETIAFEIATETGLSIGITYDYKNFFRLTDVRHSFAPDWSPDKQWLVYIHSNDFTTYDIWKMRYDGSNKVKIATDVSEFARPIISPSCKKLVYLDSDINNNSIIVTTDINGYNYKKILSSGTLPGKDWCYVWNPCWKLSDDEIAFLYNEKKTDYYGVGYLNLETNSISYMACIDSLAPLAFKWSPTRDEVVLHGKGDIGAQIWAINADGTNLRKLSNCFLAGIPDWSMDGEKVIFSQLTEGFEDNFTIWAVNRDGTGLTQLTLNKYSITNPAW